MKKYIFTLIILLSCNIFCFTKPTKIESTKASSAINILNKQLKGFEADYLTKKEFRQQVKQKKFWGIVEFIIDLVASLFNDSYGKYDEDTYTNEGPYFLFDRGKGAATLGWQLEILRAKITGLDKNNEPVIKDNFDKISTYNPKPTNHPTPKHPLLDMLAQRM
jgi:hypothetical protein